MNRIAANKEPWTLVVPSLKDPRCTIAAALTLWTVLGQTAYYFNRDPLQLGVAIASACLLDFAITAWWRRQLVVPLSAYITAMSVAILLESYDWRVFVVAPAWAANSTQNWPEEFQGAMAGFPDTPITAPTKLDAATFSKRMMPYYDFGKSGANCRFFVDVYDSTTTKESWKSGLETVERFFYKRLM